ncbi:MAG: exodeoxyribonuclease VII small subunit [Clostridia bacterium]|nr:exodeoxyribonuclease VII small subunit [Clostridia bacterium]
MKDIESMTLEETMEKLEDTVAKLESAALSLEKSMELFEIGVKLTTHAQALLDGYTKRITVLKKENDALTEAEWEAPDDGGLA